MIPAFEFNSPTRLVFRPGAARELGAIVDPRFGRKILLVTDPGLSKLGLCNPAIQSLETSGYEVTIFDEVEADPSQATLLSAVDLGRSTSAAGIIGFGGGSSLDVAKLASLLLGSDETLDTIWGVGLAKGPRLPLVLVPTTAGTGSEVTPVSIITVDQAEKRGVSSSVILPDLAVLDAELTVGLPGLTTAATGVDAMVHAIEAYASSNPNNNPVSQMFAREALRLLGANIRKAVSQPDNIDARSAMLLGSMLAGQSFANSPVAAVHALAYPIGGTFHVAHGLSNALVLPHVLRFNASVAFARYAEIAADAFPQLGKIIDQEERCTAFIESLASLLKNLAIPTRLRDVDIPETALGKMSKDAMLQTRLLGNNPRDLGESDALQIYRAAW